MKILAIIGTYRKGGIIDTAVGEILDAAREHGAEAEKIYLIDRRIEFCTNCRNCTQAPGPAPGPCVIDDDMRAVLTAIGGADALVLASPMNFWTVTAVMKRFVERLICLVYWPWQTAAPKPRVDRIPKRAVLVASSAAPALISRLSTRLVKLLKETAELLGARPIGVLFVGLAAREEHQDIGPRARKKARKLGRKLASLRVPAGT